MICEFTKFLLLFLLIMCALPVNVTTNTYFFHMNNIAKYSGVCVYPNALLTFYIFFKKIARFDKTM